MAVHIQAYVDDGGGGKSASEIAIENLIAIARAEIGYLEKKSNSQLDDKTANAGDKNYTKYARDLYEADYYYDGKRHNKNGQPWCDVFVDWCFYRLCGKDAKAAQEMTCQTGPAGAACRYSRQYYQKAGRLYSDPQPGDQIFFYTSGSTVGHTGIVYKVDSKRVYTIEGNTSSDAGVVANGGGVFEKSYSLSSSKLAGYGRPKFNNVSGDPWSPGGSGGATSTPAAPVVPVQTVDEVAAIIAKNDIKAIITDISPTTATITISSANKKSRKYSYTDTHNSFIKTVELSPTGNIINLTDLEPRMVYLVKITATGSSYAAERQVIFETPQELPGQVQSFSASFNSGTLLNKTCTVKFSAPKSVWGSYNYENRTKGYRVSLLINNRVVAYSDSLIKYSSASSSVSKTFYLSDLIGSKNISAAYGDNIQVGIHTWVKDDFGNMLLSDDGLVCSAPTFLKSSITLVDKIFLKTSSNFHRTILYIIDN